MRVSAVVVAIVACLLAVAGMPVVAQEEPATPKGDEGPQEPTTEGDGPGPVVDLESVERYLELKPLVGGHERLQFRLAESLLKTRHRTKQHLGLRALKRRRADFEKSIGTTLTRFQAQEQAIFDVHHARKRAVEAELEVLRVEKELEVARRGKEQEDVTREVEARLAAARARLQRMRSRYGGYPQAARAAIEARFDSLDRTLGGPARRPDGQLVTPPGVPSPPAEDTADSHQRRSTEPAGR